MNDFTKEELEGIYDGFDDCWRMQPENKIILNKIQSMINDYDAQVIQAWHCEKCGHVQ